MLNSLAVCLWGSSFTYGSPDASTLYIPLFYACMYLTWKHGWYKLEFVESVPSGLIYFMLIWDNSITSIMKFCLQCSLIFCFQLIICFAMMRFPTCWLTCYWQLYSHWLCMTCTACFYTYIGNVFPVNKGNCWWPRHLQFELEVVAWTHWCCESRAGSFWHNNSRKYPVRQRWCDTGRHWKSNKDGECSWLYHGSPRGKFNVFLVFQTWHKLALCKTN